MILVLANSRDLPARRLVETWRAHDARLLTLADLSRAGWRHYLGESVPRSRDRVRRAHPGRVDQRRDHPDPVGHAEVLHVVDGAAAVASPRSARSCSRGSAS